MINYNFQLKSIFDKLVMIRTLTKYANLIPKNLTTCLGYKVHHDGFQLPRQFSFYFPPHHQKILKQRRRELLPQKLVQFFDVLLIPGYNQQTVVDLYSEYRQGKVPLSAQTLCALIHTFIKFDLMNDKVFNLLENQAYKHKGQYITRSIFGGLKGSIQFNRTGLTNFFIEEYHSGGQKFTINQYIQLLKALTESKNMQNQLKIQLWNKNFRTDFLDAFLNVKIKDLQLLETIVKGLLSMQQQDSEVWQRVVKCLSWKKGQSCIKALQLLKQISQKSQNAQKVFNAYAKKIKKDKILKRRYNVQKLRYYSPLQMFERLQKDPRDYYPKQRTLIPEGENPQQWNKKYEQFLLVGSVKQQQQIIRDKSKSLGFAIKQRYEIMKADKIDFSKMSKQQFQQMFGSYDDALSTIQKQDIKIAQMQQASQQNLQETVSEQQQQQESKSKKSKGKNKKQDDSSQNNQKKGEKKQKQQAGKKQKNKKKENKQE